MYKDFTIGTSNQENQEPTFNVSFVLIDSGSMKLALVKAIKDSTGMGLKESKDFVYDCEYNHIQSRFRKNMTRKELDKFRMSLSNTNAKYTLDDISSNRNRKLIQVGIYEKSDLIDEISNMDIHKLYESELTIQKIKDLLCDIYSNLEEEKLKEIYDKYESYF
jgi:ribosomal protein L7/L12